MMIKNFSLLFVERPPFQSNHTLVIPFCMFRFRVPGLLMPVHKLDLFVRFHLPTGGFRYLRRKVLCMSRQDKINFLRTFVGERNRLWGVADVVRLRARYKEHNRLSSMRQSIIHKFEFDDCVEKVKVLGGVLNE